MFKDYTLEEFVNKLASSEPTPGGGSVAAFTGALSAALNQMVYSLTTGKKKFQELEDLEKKTVTDSVFRTKNYIKDFFEAMEEDKRAFELLMDSYKLPKDSEEEKNYRKNKIKQNTIGATEAPLSLARASLKMYNEIEIAAKYGNKGAISDAGVAAILLHAAVESASINVKINLAYIEDEEYRNSVAREINYIQVESAYKKDNLLRTINNIIEGK